MRDEIDVRLGRSHTWVEAPALAAVFLLPLAFWPSLARPFSVPKFWLLTALASWLTAAEILFTAWPRSRPAATTNWARHVAWPWLAWLAVVGLSAAFASFASFEALALIVLPLPLFLAICARQVDPYRLVRAIKWSSTVVAIVAVLQWLGNDPLRLLGWTPDLPGASRMRVYATLGNPNFAAAWLCATLPLAFPRRVSGRPLRVVPTILHACAIAATGSRIVLLALPAAAVVLMVSSRSRNRWRWAIVLPLAVVAAWVSPARPLGVTVAGRYYLARSVASHLLSVPVVGHGPGSLEERFASWQAETLRDHAESVATRAFAGPVDHVHNDYLEFFVEYGPLGLLAFLVLCAWLAVRAAPRSSLTGAAALAGAASLAVTALVDFPFHRPAEWALLWMLLAVAVAAHGEGQEQLSV